MKGACLRPGALLLNATRLTGRVKFSSMFSVVKADALPFLHGSWRLHFLVEHHALRHPHSFAEAAAGLCTGYPFPQPPWRFRYDRPGRLVSTLEHIGPPAAHSTERRRDRLLTAHTPPARPV